MWFLADTSAAHGNRKTRKKIELAFCLEMSRCRPGSGQGSDASSKHRLADVACEATMAPQ